MLYESESLKFKFWYKDKNNPVHIIVASYYSGGSKYTHDATEDGIVIGIKVIIKVLLIVVRLSFLKLQLEKIHKTKSNALMARK